MLLNNTQVSKLHKAFENKSSANTKLLKTQLHKIGQSKGFLDRFLGLLLRIGFPLIRNVLKSLGKSVLALLGLTAPPADAGIHKKMFGSGRRPSDFAKWTVLIIYNEEMHDIMKIVKWLEESGLLRKDVSETIKNEAKGQKGGILSI